jgi:hypothetical protein
MLIRSEMERKYPGLYKTLSKLKSYVKNNPTVIKSMADTSGYSQSKILKLLSLKNLVNLVRVGGTGMNWGQFFGEKSLPSFDPTHVHIRTDLVKSIDNGGFKAKMFGESETVEGTSFFAGVTILHELVHYGRYWNNLPRSPKCSLKT